MDTRTVEIGAGASIAWDCAGVGDPTLLIPGQAVTRESWAPVVPALARHVRVITMDHRGIGGSSEGDDPEGTTRGMAHDVVRFLDALGIARVHVVGHSLGGRVAQWVALDSPERVGGLVLLSTTAGDAGGQTRSEQATRDLASGDPQRLGPHFFTEEHWRAHPDAMGVFVRKEGSVGTRRRAFEASSTHDVWNRLASIECPTLVVHGAADTITPVSHGRALAAAIPGASYLEVPEGRHAVHLEQPAVVQTVIDFLAAQPLKEPG